MIRLVTGEIDARLDELTSLLAKMEKRQVSLQGSGRATLLPDANVFIHCKPFEELAWNDLTEGLPARLVISLAVVDELDRLKQASKVLTRSAARKSLRSFEELGLADGVAAQLNEELSIEILAEERSHVRAPTTDQEVLETALEIGSATTGFVSVVTGDLGMLVRARSTGAKAFKVPSDWEVPD
jgi:predicted ribonuclease YlaK